MSVIFENLEDGTTVIERFEPENIHSKELQKAGWQMILDQFKFYVEQS